MEVRQVFRFINNLPIFRLMMTTICLMVLFYGAYLPYPSIRAHSLFKELETLQLGHSTFENAERLAKKIHAEPYGACDRSRCEWDRRIDNAWLPRWWRGSGETFSVSFSVKDSIVVRKNTAYGVGIDGSFHPSVVDFEEQEQWGRPTARGLYQAGWKTTEFYPYFEFNVGMTPNASAEDRRRYTSFNFNCFWKYKGCRDARELLPTADPLHDDK
jgi:hypothetical protein